MKTNYQARDLEAFLAGELKEGDLWEFRKEMESNQELKKEVQLHQEVYESITDQQKWDLLKTIQDIRKANTSKRRISLYSWRTQAIAASIIFFIMVGSLLSSNYFSKTSSNEDIFNSHFNVENAMLTLRSQSVNDAALVENGMDVFSSGDYEQAIQILEAKPKNMMAKLYVGLSYMKLEDFSKAEEAFTTILKHNDNLFTDQAEWNLGLCYIIQDQTTKASTTFRKIAEGNTSYKQGAQEILLELEER